MDSFGTSTSAKTARQEKSQLLKLVHKCTFPLPMAQLAQLSHHLSPQQHFVLHLLHLEARDFFYLQVDAGACHRVAQALGCP